MDDGGGRVGWYAYEPEAAGSGDLEDPTRSVRLWDGEPEAGPFWEGGVLISNDFDELHKWIGTSRELFEDAMAWHEEYASLRTKPNDDWKRQHFDRQRELLQRLRARSAPASRSTAGLRGRVSRRTDPPAPYGISSARA